MLLEIEKFRLDIFIWKLIHYKIFFYDNCKKYWFELFKLNLIGK